MARRLSAEPHRTATRADVLTAAREILDEVYAAQLEDVRNTFAARSNAGRSATDLTDVARAGNQIDLVVNPNLLPGAPNPGAGLARPAFVPRQSNAWLQGISVGLNVSW